MKYIYNIIIRILKEKLLDNKPFDHIIKDYIQCRPTL